MKTEIVTVDPTKPDPGAIADAAARIRAGRLVAFPTETVYGLGANALDPTAVRGIFCAKGRPSSNPLIVHLLDLHELANVAAEWPATAQLLATRFWPGPLTIVVPKANGIPDELTASGPTIALRCPSHPVARALLGAASVPIAAQSANRSTELSPTCAEHVRKSLEGRVDLILDGGPCPGGIESTVVDVTGKIVRLLRPGQITIPMLEGVVGPIAVGTEIEGPIRSPGQAFRHYSPRTPLRLVNREAFDAMKASLRIAGTRYCVLRINENPEVAEQELYGSLHALDEAGHDLILVERPPDTWEWLAVNDRLSRAAAE